MALGVIGGPARLATNPVDDPPAPPPEQREPPIIQCSTVPKDEEGVITSLAFHPGGNTLAACNDHGMAKYFDVASAHQTRAFRVQERRWGGLRALLFTPDGAILFAGVYFQKAPAVLDAAT